tara:strand:- start:309 stop:866 length:558 start_codon:yes stop_codon:yes gene_type:complete
MKKILLLVLLLLLSSVSAQDSLDDSLLFDIQVEILDDYKIISPGEEVISSIKLVNLGSSQRADVFLEYWISDLDQNIILIKTETIAIETQTNLVRSFDIPEDIEEGKYNLYAKITYGSNEEAIAYHSFEVIEGLTNYKLVYYSLFLLLVFLFITIFGIKSKTLIRKIIIRIKVWQIVRNRFKKRK